MIQQFKLDLTNAIAAVNGTCKYTDRTGSNGQPDTLSKVTNIMNKTFNSIIIIVMFLCFFALSANMSANLYEQTKEIGVLRAIGFTKTRIKMLYFYEAMVLVLASCLLGVMVGLIVAETMTL
jgi:ABC-type antimicrobial peptide transport system permease subunit